MATGPGVSRWLRKRARSIHFYPSWYYFPLLLDDYRKGDDQAALADALKLDTPEFYWTQIMLAQIYGQLGETGAAREAVDKLAVLYPGFSLDAARDEYRVWNISDELIGRALDGLRKAGVPEGTWN